MATRPRKTKAANEWQTDETKYNTDVELIESMEEMLCMIEIVRRRETIAHSRSERPTLAYAPNVSEGLTEGLTIHVLSGSPLSQDQW